MKLGDAISSVATPIARAFNMPCIDEQGKLRPESGCAGRRNQLNNWRDAIWDFLFSNDKQEGTNMEYIVTKQIKVEADDVEGALKNAIEGKGTTIGMSANPRPVPQPPQARPSPVVSGQQPRPIPGSA